MTITKSITQKQFDGLLASMDYYDLLGITGEADDWVALRFKYSGDSTVGRDFKLERPFSRLTGSIDKKTVEIQFSTVNPFELNVVFKITDAIQISLLESAVFPAISASEF
jgi:hypothetical protein